MALLARGSTGPAVSELQGMLNSVGYSVASDGIYGPATEAAVRGFQTASGLTPDGLYGPQTQNALSSLVLSQSGALRPNTYTAPPLIEMPPIDIIGTVPPETTANAGSGVVIGLALAVGAYVVMSSGKKGRGRGRHRRSSGRRRRRR